MSSLGPDVSHCAVSDQILRNWHQSYQQPTLTFVRGFHNYEKYQSGLTGVSFSMTVSVWLLTLLAASITADLATSPFTPALPGDTPACAKKGKSFCEYVPGYPE